MRNKFDEQLEALHIELIKMGCLCETAIANASKSLQNANEDILNNIAEIENDIDQKERDIEGLCMKLLLQQQPVATDLRIVSAAMKMVSDMERIGDQASDIAEITKYINSNLVFDGIHLSDMASATVKMVTESITSFVKSDLERAQNVIKSDDTIDNMFNDIKTKLVKYIHNNPENSEQCLDLLMIAKYFERIGDHAANIAEWVEFSITGKYKGGKIMIYIVEDDSNISELVVYTLKMAGFDAQSFTCGTELFKQLENNIPELILLDIMLPGEDGIIILKKIRKTFQTHKIPVIMLTAKGSEYDKVTGLDCGADDYVTKPFGMMELVSRIKAVLRRYSDNTEKKELQAGNIIVDVGKHKVYVNGNEISLTFKEFEMLCMLIESKGLVLSRNKLLESIWGYDFDGETRTIDVHVRSLRQKLGNSGNIIETVRGIGYRIGEGS